MAISTVHHWFDPALGLAELARVAPRRVVFTIEPLEPSRFWLTDQYFPEIAKATRSFPTAAEIAAALGGAQVIDFPVPADFADASLGAYWNRPHRYCDPHVQRSISAFATLDDDVLRAGTDRLRDDLASGAWGDRNGHLRALSAYDVGYRLIVSTP